MWFSNFMMAIVFLMVSERLCGEFLCQAHRPEGIDSHFNDEMTKGALQIALRLIKDEWYPLKEKEFLTDTLKEEEIKEEEIKEKIREIESGHTDKKSYKFRKKERKLFLKNRVI